MTAKCQLQNKTKNTDIVDAVSNIWWWRRRWWETKSTLVNKNLIFVKLSLIGASLHWRRKIILIQNVFQCYYHTIFCYSKHILLLLKAFLTKNSTYRWSLHNHTICAITDKVSMITKKCCHRETPSKSCMTRLHFTTDWQTCGSPFQCEAENVVGSRGPDIVKS